MQLYTFQYETKELYILASLACIPQLLMLLRLK